MRKIIVLEHFSLDGVIQAPGGPDEDTSDSSLLGIDGCNDPLKRASPRNSQRCGGHFIPGRRELARRPIEVFNSIVSSMRSTGTTLEFPV